LRLRGLSCREWGLSWRRSALAFEKV
jgi:hypothetical protein